MQTDTEIQTQVKLILILAAIKSIHDVVSYDTLRSFVEFAFEFAFAFASARVLFIHLPSTGARVARLFGS